MSTCPRMTVSPCSASFTETSHRESRRLANARVNCSGMCWTTTMPGEFAGRASRTSRRASVPPVDAPMQTTISVVRLIARPLGGGSTASAVSFCSGLIRGGTGLRAVTRARAAPFTTSQMVARASLRWSATPSRGFRITSTAPASRAWSSVSEPCSVKDEHMTTGTGHWLIADHGELRIDTSASAELGDNVRSCATVPAEFRSGQAHYPIVLRRDIATGKLEALALLGFETGENLFLRDGRWDAPYRPLSTAIRPFLIGRAPTPDGAGQG